MFVSNLAGICVMLAASSIAEPAPTSLRLSVLLDKKNNTFTVGPRSPLLATTDFLPSEAAHGHWNNTYSTLGWSFLEVHSNPDLDDASAAFAAGFFEGFATAEMLEQHAVNTGVLSLARTMPDKLRSFISQNNEWVDLQVRMGSKSESMADRVYWHQVFLIQQQVAGLYKGYRKGRSDRRAAGGVFTLAAPLTKEELVLINMAGDLEDLSALMGKDHHSATDLNEQFGKGHCSALLRLVDGNRDMFVSQETWSDLNSMLRIFKLYDLPYSSNGTLHNAVVPATRSSFSSYPGTLFSGDDFYVLSSGLVVQETTIGNSANVLNKEYVSPMTLLEWQRNIVANRLAASGSDWCGILQKYNSGTYNNQFMIVDYNLFTPGVELVANTFTLCEQVPGYVRTNDLSAKLQADRYFGSYNVAYDPFIRSVSGTDEAVKKQGPWFGYDTTARAKIFQRDAPQIKDLAGMMKLMRSCNYKHDPLSTQMDTCEFLSMKNCSPAYTAENCIATRGDLNPRDGVWGLPSFAQRNHVATDAKISSFSTFDKKSLQSFIVAGPTDSEGQIPGFKWSTSPYAHTPHLGMPDDMSKFPWVHVKWEDTDVAVLV